MMADGDGDERGDWIELEESDDVKRIKEEWEKLHQEGAKERCQRIQEEVERQRAEWETSVDNIVKEDKKRQLPPTRLPSLEGCLPAAENSAGFSKKLPGLGSLGHRLGIMVDVEGLEPGTVTPEKTAYHFGKDTPTQTEITWSPPSNADKFHSLTYDMEVDGGQGWTALKDSRQPLLRVYFTSEKIIVGRYTRSQEAEPVAVRLHVRATGMVKAQGQEESVSGPWSDDIWLTLEGSCVMKNTAV